MHHTLTCMLHYANTKCNHRANATIYHQVNMRTHTPMITHATSAKPEIRRIICGTIRVEGGKISHLVIIERSNV